MNTIQGRQSSDRTIVQEIKTTDNAIHTQSSARSGSAVTPHDVNANVFDALWVGVTGDVAVQLADDSGSVTFTNVPVGWLPVNTSLVLSTGTTATGIVGIKWSA